MTRPPRDGDDDRAELLGGLRRVPPSRIVRSSCTPSRRPTGTARFCADRAPTTSPMLTLAAVSASGRMLTVISRVLTPATSTSPTPVMARRRRLMPGSASTRQLGHRQRVGRERDRHDREVDRVDPREDRFLHLGRQVVADLVDLVADLLRGFLQVLLVLELDQDRGEAVERVRRHLLHAADAGDGLFDRLDDLAFDVVGRRAGIRRGDDDERHGDVGELVGLQQHVATPSRTPRAPAC